MAETPGQSSNQNPSSAQDHVPAIHGQADGSYEERLAGTEMIDRANSGRPVLSGPAELGLKGDDEPQQDAGQAKSGQLIESARGEKSLSTAGDANL